MSESQSKVLFSVLDRWASHFLSRSGTALVMPLMVRHLGEELDRLPADFKAGPLYAELRDYFGDLVRQDDFFEHSNNNPFNVVMLDFLGEHAERLSDVGRDILRNVHSFLDGDTAK